MSMAVEWNAGSIWCEVEVDRQPLVLGLEHHRVEIREMLLHIPDGAEVVLSSPVHSATRIVLRGFAPIAFRMRTASSATAEAGAFVGRARARVPRIEVAA